MKNFIDGVDFHELSAQKYWQPPASWSKEKKKQEIEGAIFSTKYVGARKMDGAFYKFIKDEDGNMELLGRSKSVKGDYLDKIDWIPHLHDFFNDLPNGTCLLGELYFPENEGSNQVTKIMGCLKNKAIERQEKGAKLHYYIFDVLAWDNKSLLNEVMDERIKYIVNGWRAYGESYHEWAKFYEGEELWNKLQIILANGGEGIVITKRDTCYAPGKRPAHQTIKVKKELQETIDAVVIGTNAPTKTYTGKDIENWEYWENSRTKEKINKKLFKDYQEGAFIEPVTRSYFNGWAGSFIIGLYNPETDRYIQIGSLSGLTDECLSNYKNYIGKVVEVGGMEIFRDEDGNFSGVRHPKLISWREDKSAKECTINQIK
jgi:ATP-dependent DNA ligase